MIARLLERHSGHAFFGALFTLSTKIGGSASALVMFALASWTMDIAEFGELAIVFNTVSLIAVIAVLGQDILVQRSWGEYIEDDPGLVRGAFRFGIGVTLTGASVATLLFLAAAHLVDGRLTVVETAVAGAFLFSQTFLHFAANVARVVCGTRVSEPPRELSWRLPLVVALAVALFSGGRASLFVFFAVAATAQILSVAHLFVHIARGMPEAVRSATPNYLPGAWARRGVAMWLAALSEAGHQYADVVLIGHLLGAGAAAGYFVILRIAGIFSMIAGGIANYATSKISVLYFAGRLDDLRHLMGQISMLTLASTSVLFLVILFEGHWLLGVFGSEYRVFWPELIMMCAVTMVGAFAWPGSTLMLFMGADLAYMKLVAGALIVRLAALLVLAPPFGVPGAIAAVAVAVVPLNAIVVAVCIRRFGIDPSVASILTRRWLTAHWGTGRVGPDATPATSRQPDGAILGHERSGDVDG